VLAGFGFARVQGRRDTSRGFAVVPKSDEEN